MLCLSIPWRVHFRQMIDTVDRIRHPLPPSLLRPRVPPSCTEQTGRWPVRSSSGVCMQQNTPRLIMLSCVSYSCRSVHSPRDLVIICRCCILTRRQAQAVVPPKGRMSPKRSANIRLVMLRNTRESRIRWLPYHFLSCVPWSEKRACHHDRRALTCRPSNTPQAAP